MHPVQIGSAAARFYFPDFPRDPADNDYFGNEPVIRKPMNLRTEMFYHPDLERWNWGPRANRDELYTIKISHLFWPNHFPKHFKDAAFLQKKGCQFISELYELLYPIWVEHYGEKRAKLRKGTKPEEFFTSTVKRTYDHDSLHASIAYHDEPLYKAILANGEAVAVDRDKFDTLSLEDKLRLAREEVYATALERKIIPSDYRCSSLNAYRWALEQTMTSYSKGWFPLFMALHAAELMEPDVDFVERHHENADRLIPLETQ